MPPFIGVCVLLNSHFNQYWRAFRVSSHLFHKEITLVLGLVINPAGHLVCYEVKGHDEFKKRNVLVFNQFEDEVEGRILTIKKPKIVCVPSTKEDLGVVGDDDDKDRDRDDDDDRNEDNEKDD